MDLDNAMQGLADILGFENDETDGYIDKKNNHAIFSYDIDEACLSIIIPKDYDQKFFEFELDYKQFNRIRDDTGLILKSFHVQNGDSEDQTVVYLNLMFHNTGLVE